MDVSTINRCIRCTGIAEQSTFGAFNKDGVGSETAVIACACGQSTNYTATEISRALPVAIAQWDALNESA